MANETPSRPPPFHGKCHLKFPFWLFAHFPYLAHPTGCPAVTVLWRTYTVYTTIANLLTISSSSLNCFAFDMFHMRCIWGRLKNANIERNTTQQTSPFQASLTKASNVIIEEDFETETYKEKQIKKHFLFQASQRSFFEKNKITCLKELQDLRARWSRPPFQNWEMVEM